MLSGNYSSEPLKPSIPPFKTILWDNVKTTTIYGGVTVGVPGGLLSGAFICVSGIVLCAPEAILPAFWAGAYVTGFVAAPITTLMGLPFAISARFTRQFKANSYIQTTLEKLNDIDDERKKKIIKSALINIGSQAYGITSLESNSLINDLRYDGEDDEAESINKKWSALISYMSARSYSNSDYVHNGKKTFNAVIDAIETETQNNDLHSELQSLYQIIHSPIWNKKGFGFLRKHTPDTITELRSCFSNNGINMRYHLDSSMLGANQLSTLISALKSTVKAREEKIRFRSLETKHLCKVINCLGEINNKTSIAKLSQKFLMDEKMTETLPLLVSSP